MQFHHYYSTRPIALAVAMLLAGLTSTPINALADDPSPAAPEADQNTPDTVVVTASERLRTARSELSPNIGTTRYEIDQQMIDNLGQGDNTPFDAILLRLPGVAQDSKASGSLHIRDDHANVQYRINGVILPDGISSGFGETLDSRVVDSIDFVTGALPAQYGLRTAGVIDIETKEGNLTPGGKVGVLAGSNNFFQPSAAIFGGSGAMSYFFTGSYLQNSIGIENPISTRDPIHDQTYQSKSFGNLTYYLGDDSRLSLMFGTYDGRFEIPNNPSQSPQYALPGYSDLASGMNNYPSASLNERQVEENRFAVLSYQKTLGDLNFQLSGFHQYSAVQYIPDGIGDLIYNGISSDILRNSVANGMQFDASYRLNPQHTMRAGTSYQQQNTEANNSSQVFPLQGGEPLTTPVTIVDNGSRLGTTGSLYVQDQWTLSPAATLNYGLRYDQVSAFVSEHQWSPRLNMLVKLSDSTALHGGYSRYFTPPPQELLSQSSVNLYNNTTGAAPVPVSDPVKAERTNYFDLGIVHDFDKHLSLTVDAYYKQIHNLLDEGQFGQALILTPFNYDHGYAKGLEFSATYNGKDWGAFTNIALQKAQGTNIVSGQATFAPDELAYIADHYVYLDHNQTFSVSGGANTKLGDYKLAGDFLYGSGLRDTPEGGAPNSASLPDYITFNANLTRNWKTAWPGNIEGRLALLNILDRSYMLRDGTGIGVGAPQYGARRTLFVGMSANF